MDDTDNTDATGGDGAGAIVRKIAVAPGMIVSAYDNDNDEDHVEHDGEEDGGRGQ